MTLPAPTLAATAGGAERRHRLLQGLARVLPAEAIVADPEATAAFECDALSAYRVRPLVVVLPRTDDEVAAVLATCRALGTPVVARGAGTGLSGGALPHAEGVTLSLARLNRILEVDPVACTATVQAGVRNLAISDAAAPHGLYYAPDPSSQLACTIGGNVAENSGGVHCLKYGLTLHNVLCVRGYTIDGERIEFGGLALDTPGLDLLSIVVGSEGMLAVVTEVTVRLLPRPDVARCILASFATVEAAGRAVAEVIAAGVIPAGLELMDQRMVGAAEKFVHAGYDLDAAAILLCESDGTAVEVDAEIERITKILNACGATRIEASRDEAERLRFWSGRKNAFAASGQLSPDYMCMDSTIPRRRLAEMLRAIEEMQSRYGLTCVNVFHAGDGNLHPLILFNANDPDELHRCESFGAEILETSVRLGGTISGEHGVGIEKLNSMCVQFSADEREQMFRIKRAFDPAELLNPGKVIPTLHRCAEYGRMHVHRGAGAFPDLPRF